MTARSGFIAETASRLLRLTTDGSGTSNWVYPTGRWITAASRLLLLGFIAMAISACASRPPADDKEAVAAYEEANDPLEPLNRYLFEVNLAIDRLFLRPVAEIYRGVAPKLVQDGIRNGLNNLDTPLTFIHDVLQGEEKRAANSTGRFLANTFYGVGGVFDIAAGEGEAGRKHGIPHHSEDLGQTLAVYGVEPGPYLMLPLLGPSNVRDAIGKVGDSFIDPVQFIVDDKNRLGFSLARGGLRGLDSRARNIETLDDIERDAIDFYATVRSLYRQHRAAEIANGRQVELDAPGTSGQLNFDEFDADSEPQSAEDTPKSTDG